MLISYSKPLNQSKVALKRLCVRINIDGGETMISHAVSGSHVIFNKSPPPHILQHSYLKCVQSWVTGWVKKLKPLMLLRRIIQSHPDTTLSLFSSLSSWCFPSNQTNAVDADGSVVQVEWGQERDWGTEVSRTAEGLCRTKGIKEYTAEMLIFFNSMIRVGMWHSPNCCKWPMPWEW